MTVEENQTVRDLRRRWKPKKESLNAECDSHPTVVRMHRAFSWLGRAEDIVDEKDDDFTLVCQWVAFNALYGNWNGDDREPSPDRESWRSFVDRILVLDVERQVAGTLDTHKKLVLSLLDDEYLSKYFWREPSKENAPKSRKKKKAQYWFHDESWTLILDELMDRIYLIRCQLIHGAATYGGKLNRKSLHRCTMMLDHLLRSFLLVMIDHGSETDWGEMCYPPLH